MRCSKCKNKLQKNAKFCPVCGTKVKKRRMKKFLIFFSILIVVISGIGIAGWKMGALDSFLSPDKESVMSRTYKIKNSRQAIAHAKKFGEAYGYKNAFSELTEKDISVVDGDSYYRLQQNYKGIPVYKRTVVYATNEKNEVTDITGNAEDVDQTIDLTPTVTQEQVEESIRSYVKEMLNTDDDDSLAIDDLKNDDLCIYNFTEDGQTYLAYWIMINGYEFVVDAKTGRIFTVNSLVKTTLGYMASDEKYENGFPIEERKEGFNLADGKIKGIGDLRGKSSEKNKNMENCFWTVSSDHIFGNEKKEKNYEKAVRLYLNIRKIKSYFKSICGFDSEIYAYFNDRFDWGKNAKGGTLYTNLKGDDFIGFISMGKVTGVNNLSVIGHEYGHVISNKMVEWFEQGNRSVENRAISEGISDIYSEIVTTWCYGKKNPDWVYTADEINLRRNLQNPHDTNNAVSVSDNEKDGIEEHGEGYYYSTVISHTAYLMWNGINGDETAKISLEDIVKLWYRAMNLMHSDCDFVQCREMVERSALAMNNLTKKQRECISEAFNQVGIQKTEIGDQEGIYTNYDVLVVNVTGSKEDIYDTYMNAAKEVTKSGSWREILSAEADMEIKSEDEKQKAKMKATLKSDANVEDYNEQNLSTVKISGNASIRVGEQTTAWTAQYSDGVAHYEFTEPTVYSKDAVIDPVYFKFSSLTYDMILEASKSENKIYFTVDGNKMSEFASEMINLIDGIENLKYGNCDVTVTIDDNTKQIENVNMIFHASMKYQGYNAEADYNVEYGFEAPKIVRKEISGELVDAYAPIFLEYQQAINTYDESNTAQFSNEFPDVREILVKSNKYNGTEIWYGFYDIDGNGMEELLLATEDAQAIGGYRIADVFTYDMTGVQIKNIGKDIISSEDIATGQYNSVIYDTGIFRINKSDSEEFYNISADESYMELVKRYNRLENSSGEIYYFDDSEMLSYDKFMQHVLERKGDIAEIEWLKLSEVTVL